MLSAEHNTHGGYNGDSNKGCLLLVTENNNFYKIIYQLVIKLIDVVGKHRQKEFRLKED